MRQRWSETIKGWVRPLWYKTFYPGQPAYECPICGYRGPFKDKRVSRTPDVVREAAKCVRCGAVERHRIQYLVINEVLPAWGAARKKVLHLAPEFCLQPRLRELFGTYHTADLFREDVDFKEDIQRMSFADGSYDCVFVSRVLTDIGDLEAAIRELRRILSPGGLAFIAEAYVCEKSNEFSPKRGERAREIGLDALDLYARHFVRVDHYLSNRYDPKYQLFDRMRVNGQVMDEFPEAVRAKGVGGIEVVAVGHG
jgi:SAM-dependent methyltransferase